MNEKETLMNELQAVGFSLTDLGMYLDSHPDNAQALEKFGLLRKQYASLVRKYEESFGPLTAGGGGNSDYWDWVAGPMPWENC